MENTINKKNAVIARSDNDEAISRKHLTQEIATPRLVVARDDEFLTLLRKVIAHPE